jgi:outer membrane lipoprotein SlyB
MQWMKRVVVATCILVTAQAWADDKVKIAVGAGVGAAVGAVIGDELGDRNGAIVGSALGAAVGTAIVTQDGHDHTGDVKMVPVKVEIVVQDGHPKGRHCPPGQAKKGRC